MLLLTCHYTKTLYDPNLYSLGKAVLACARSLFEQLEKEAGEHTSFPEERKARFVRGLGACGSVSWCLGLSGIMASPDI